MKTELQSVVEYMDILNKLDTENVEPLSHIVDITNVLREDEVVPSYPREDVLKNAPARTDSNFVVPKTVE
jgi:aspartyl-tRNA(Asn)/glutamyl-tRNA(Gln) amidotransferase subunit C